MQLHISRATAWKTCNQTEFYKQDKVNKYSYIVFNKTSHLNCTLCHLEGSINKSLVLNLILCLGSASCSQ